MKLPFHIRRFLREETGATAIEYAMIAMLVSMAAISAFMLVTQAINTNYFSLMAGIPR